MASYTVTIDERTKDGKSLEEPNDTTLLAIQQIRKGEGTLCETFDDYLKTVSSLSILSPLESA